jgi:hypothetical protein
MACLHCLHRLHCSQRYIVLPVCTACAAASIVLGKLSGRKAVTARLEQLGFGLTAEEVNDVFKRFKVRRIQGCEVL